VSSPSRAPAAIAFSACFRPQNASGSKKKYDSLASCPRFRKSNSSTFKDLQTQIQGLSRTMTFQALKICKNYSRTFKDPQEPCIRATTVLNGTEMREMKQVLVCKEHG